MLILFNEEASLAQQFKMCRFFLLIKNRREIKVNYDSVYVYSSFNGHTNHSQKASNNLIYAHPFGG